MKLSSVLLTLIAIIFVLCFLDQGDELLPSNYELRVTASEQAEVMVNAKSELTIKTINNAFSRFSSIQIEFPLEKSVDLSNIDYLSFQFETTQNLFIYPKIGDFINQTLHYHIFSGPRLHIKTEQDNYSLNARIDEFKLEDWFQTTTGKTRAVSESDITSNADLFVIEILTESSLPKLYSFKLKSVKGIRDYTIIYVICTLAALAILGFHGYAFYGRTLRKKNTKKSEKDPEFQHIISYIQKEYNNLQLSIEMVSEHTNTSKYKIRQAIKSKFDMSYPRYINHLRLNEAKRLLRTTEIPIIDVAISAGYNSVAHFNRIFKNETNKTPNQYRQSSLPHNFKKQ